MGRKYFLLIGFGGFSHVCRREALAATNAEYIAAPHTGNTGIALPKFLRIVVRYGPAKDDLGKTSIDGELRKYHTVILDGMGPGTTLYCQITSTDQSGNAAVSPIFQASGTHYVYMPSLER